MNCSIRKVQMFVLTPLLLAAGALTSQAQQEWIDMPLSENTFSEGSVPFKTGSYSIPLGAYEALEFKLGIAEGDVVVYEWDVEMSEPDQLAVEFHGHTEPEPGEAGNLMFYKIHSDGHESGSLKAPFTGIHGWYLNNQTDQDIVVNLQAAGFYTEVE